MKFDKVKFWKKTKEDKNKKLSSESIKIRLHKLINGTAYETYCFEAYLKRDNNDNTIMFNEELSFKEEVPGLQDSLVSDILYKLENRGLSTDLQIKNVNIAINKQEDIIKSIKNGYIIIKDEKFKVNIRTEESKLRLFKCVKYTLENKKGEGYYESIERDGSRVLNYLIRDGDLIPYFFRTPTSEGQPVILVPDVVQRKKFYKESTTEIINDFNESQDFMWKGWLGFAIKGLVVLLILSNIFWSYQNMKFSKNIYDESVAPQLKELQVQNEKIKQECTNALKNQIENNDELIDYAKTKLKNEQEKTENIDKSKISI